MTDYPMTQPVETSQFFLPSYVELMMSNFKDKFRENYDISLCAQEKKYTHLLFTFNISMYTR